MGTTPMTLLEEPLLAWTPRILIALALLAGCTPDPTAAGAGKSGDPYANASAPPKDPLWGNIVIPSPSPGDTNPLKVRTERNEVFYSLHREGPKVITYISRRLEDKDDVLHKGEFLHTESDDPLSHYEVVLSYKRFYKGHYSVTAYQDNDPVPAGERAFAIE
ncbi:MAG: hypothetical protein JWM80_6626 [Cyanobacteria bacterium RYN_339]|nr:hypothetical protein [Cyanobacteria bacterium RYN_339]